MIIVVGIPGSGKSTLLGKLQEAAPAVRIVNYGEMMLEVASLPKERRDLLRKLPDHEQRKIGLEVAHKIRDKADEKTLVDTHALIKTPYGFRPGLPRDVLEILAPRVCAMVDCVPEKILQRRGKDGSNRNRDQESTEELKLHQQLTLTYLCTCCMLSGALFCRVSNDSDDLAKNIRPLLEIL